MELVVVDNQSQTDKAVTAAQTLVSEGDVGGDRLLRLRRVDGGRRGVRAGAGAGDRLLLHQPGRDVAGDYYWRICYIDPFQGTVMANFAMEQGAQNAYVLTQLGDDYSTGLGFYFQQAFESLGGNGGGGDLHRGHQRLYRLSEQRHQPPAPTSCSRRARPPPPR